MLHMSIQGSGEHPAFPAQWLYGLYDFVLVTGFLATIIIGSFRLRQLDASTGASDPNDFAVRKCRARQSLPHVHRSLPLVCDDGQRPLVGQDGGVLRCVYLTVEAEYFSTSELTNIWGDLPVGQAQKLCRFQRL
jgi:hypothetical protein